MQKSLEYLIWMAAIMCLFPNPCLGLDPGYYSDRQKVNEIFHYLTNNTDRIIYFHRVDKIDIEIMHEDGNGKRLFFTRKQLEPWLRNEKHKQLVWAIIMPDDDTPVWKENHQNVSWSDDIQEFLILVGYKRVVITKAASSGIVVISDVTPTQSTK